MKGRPWFRFLLTLIGCAAVAWPIWIISMESHPSISSQPSPDHVAKPDEGSAVADIPIPDPKHPPVHVEIDFAPPAAEVEILAEGSPLPLQSPVPDAMALEQIPRTDGLIERVVADIPMIIPTIGQEVALVVKWKKPAATVASVPNATAMGASPTQAPAIAIPPVILPPVPAEVPRPAPTQTPGNQIDPNPVNCAVHFVAKLPHGKIVDETYWSKNRTELTELIRLPGTRLPNPLAVPPGLLPVMPPVQPPEPPLAKPSPTPKAGHHHHAHSH